MTKTNGKRSKTTGRERRTPGERIIRGLDQAIAWARGEDVPVRVTTIEVPVIDVSAIRRKLKLSQSQFCVEVRLRRGHSAQLGAGPNQAGRCCWR